MRFEGAAPPSPNIPQANHSVVGSQSDRGVVRRDGNSRNVVSVVERPDDSTRLYVPKINDVVASGDK